MILEFEDVDPDKFAQLVTDAPDWVEWIALLAAGDRKKADETAPSLKRRDGQYNYSFWQEW
ncbi:MAG: hypothetical protein V7K27_20130 [Nostoc sp.]|uniref:hypothetical protein n=1 Tax=Nostoc sp. TaxID=1180 RepID=UPI002FF5781A